MDKIQVTYSRENIISRTFGLFPYYEFNDNLAIIHVATDSSTGCYEKIVPNLVLPVDFYVEENLVLEHDHTYTYRYLMDLYVEYKDVYPKSDFVVFFERGIGKKYIDLEEIGLSDAEKYRLVPDVIYLSRVTSMIDMLKKLKKTSELSDTSSYVDCDTCKAKNDYIAYGGDIFLNYLETLLSETYEIANEFFHYASNDILKVMFDVPLLQTNFDLGVNECYINKWVPGERYYCGDIVTYNGITYVCVLNQIIQTPCDEFYFIDDYVENSFYNNSGTQCQYVMCNNIFYVLNTETNQYEEEAIHHVDCFELYVSCSTELYEYIECDGIYYHLEDDVYEVITICEYTTGVYDEATHTIGFDYAHFIPITDFVRQPENSDINIPLTQDEIDGWYCPNNVYGTKYKIFIDVEYMPAEFVYEYIRFLGNFYIWNGTEYVIDSNNCGIYKLYGTSESILKQFAAKDSFYSSANEIIVPEFGNDFLYFYKKGKTVNVKNRYVEENGNIERYTNSPIYINQEVTDLYSYGDILYDIVVLPEERKIKFYYVIWAHLKAICTDITLNEFLEPLYFYDGGFLYDDQDTHGLKYVETYEYDENSDVDELVSDGNFEYYITNYNSDIIIKDNLTQTYIIQGVDMDYIVTNSPTTEPITTPYILVPGTDTVIGDIYKSNGSSYYNYSNNVIVYNYTGKPMLFHTTDNDVKTVSVKYNCNEYDYTFINSEYSEDVVNELDVIYNPLFKKDYLNGIAYVNEVNGGINIGRGNAASFERHVKLGEVKTMEDLDSYSNGGFFNVITY